MKLGQLFLGRRIAAVLLAIALPAAALAATSPAGVPNFQKVNDHVYRGAQPTEEGFRNLAESGIKIVVDLRESGDRSLAEERVVRAAGMEYITVPMNGMETPSTEKVAKVLALLEDNSAGPVFVHCKRGADRTGAVLACYRIYHDHWNNDRALREAKSLGMSFFQVAIQRYVRAFQPQMLNIGTSVANAAAHAIAQ